MSGRETRASRDLTHLSVAQVLNQPRGRGRGSRSPSPALLSGPAFFPTAAATASEEDSDEAFADAIEEGTMANIPEDATPEQIRRIAEEAQQESRNLRSQQDRMTAALEAATQAAANATAALQALSLNNSAQAAATTTTKRKRPELPALDKTNIHIWIQRVESAYAREEVTDPKQKFAFLESIIGVNLGPTINNFMFGEATAQNWTAFLEHLKDVYGPTKETRCSIYLDGIKRNGLRPTDHLALIRDRAKDVSIDDLQKQLIIRELPSDVKKLVQDKVEKLDAAATASLADAHFEKDGRPRNGDASVSSVTQQPLQQTPIHGNNSNSGNQLQDLAAEVNAVPGRRPQAPRRNNNRSTNNNRGGHSSNPSPYTPAFPSAASQPHPQSVPRPGTSTNRQSNLNANPTNPSEERQYSNCKLHAANPNSQVCNGPLCPLHSRAALCYSRRCSAHAQGGNGRGGRR